MDKGILIVGGAGYIGSMVNKVLARAGYKTFVLDSLVTGHADNVVAGELIVEDLGNRDALRTLLRTHPIDAVIHLGARTSVGESMLSPARYYNSNIGKTIILLEEVIARKIPHFLFSSSAAIYGAPKSVPIDEEHPKQPINPYGRTKWMVEQILRDFSDAYGLGCCSLRYFNAAGGDPEGEVLDRREQPVNVIPIILRSILAGSREAPIFGTDYDTPDGTCIRDYIHIYDLAVAHLLALEKLMDDSAADAYNLGNGSGFSVREVVDTIAEVTGIPLGVKEEPRRPGDPPRLVADSTKARRELGWDPKYSQLEQIVEDSWKAISPTAGTPS